MIQIRQGDIFLQPVDMTNPVYSDISKFKKISDNKYTLAYGETTGHSHVMQGKVSFYDNGGQILCNVTGDTELVHEEHGRIEIPEGNYLVVYQREYDVLESTIRRVMD